MFKQFNKSYSSRPFPSLETSPVSLHPGHNIVETTRRCFRSINELASKLTSLLYFISDSLFSFARTKEFPSSLKTRQKCAYTVLHCLWQMINYSKFPFSSLIHLSRERRGGKKKEIITLNCISKQQYLHARILSRPYGANDNLFCLDSAAIASPHYREKHCLGATPTSHDTRRLCFVVPWNWLPSCSLPTLFPSLEFHEYSLLIR